jgi:hypothetical protein
MRAEELKRHLDALLLRWKTARGMADDLPGARSDWRDFAATISAALEGRTCPNPA